MPSGLTARIFVENDVTVLFDEDTLREGAIERIERILGESQNFHFISSIRLTVVS